jgi:signal transduction histidine kinase
LQAAVDAFRPPAKDRGVELVFRDPGELDTVAVDTDQFQHALQNLLDNALAHTPTGGQITLEAQAVDGHVVFSVADTGSGIPPEYVPRIFEKYFRVPGDVTVGGSGLGLAIVREIVTAHGGTVDCQSCPGERTVFRMLFPVTGGTNRVNR